MYVQAYLKPFHGLSGKVQVQWASLPPFSWGRWIPDDLPKSLPALFSVISDKFAHLCIRQASYKRSDSVSDFSLLFTASNTSPSSPEPPARFWLDRLCGSSVTPLKSRKSPGSSTDLCYRPTVWPLDTLMLLIRFTLIKTLKIPWEHCKVSLMNVCHPFCIPG